MRTIIAAAAIALSLSSGAHAQMVPDVQRSSSPRGVQIQGDTRVSANAQNVSAVAAGEGNTAKTATGAVKSGVQIQGITKIDAFTKNVNSVAVGKGNAATNDVGSIGGK